MSQDNDAARGLLPCPFCGGYPGIHTDSRNLLETAYAVRCINCSMLCGFSVSEREARDRWNRRPAPEPRGFYISEFLGNQFIRPHEEGPFRVGPSQCGIAPPSETMAEQIEREKDEARRRLVAECMAANPYAPEPATGPHRSQCSVCGEDLGFSEGDPCALCASAPPAPTDEELGRIAWDGYHRDPLCGDAVAWANAARAVAEAVRRGARRRETTPPPGERP